MGKKISRFLAPRRFARAAFSAAVAFFLLGGACYGYRQWQIRQTLFEARTYTKASLGSDLDRYFRDEESKVATIKATQQKGVVWAAKPSQITELAFVFLHGFSASRFEMSPLVENIGKHFGSNVFFGRLAGHAMDDPDAMANIQVGDWMRDVDESIEAGFRIGKKVVVIASSTSVPPLILWVLQNPGRVHGLVFLSPNFGPRNRQSQVLLYPAGLQIGRLIVHGKYREWSNATDVQKIFNTTRYRVEGLIPMMRLVDSMNAVDLGLLSEPLQILYHPGDDVVDVEEMLRKAPLFGAKIKKIEVVPHAKTHVLAGDLQSPESTDEVASMIENFVKEISPGLKIQN